MQTASKDRGPIGLFLAYKLTMDFLYIYCIWGIHQNAGWWNGPYNMNFSLGVYVSAWLIFAILLALFQPTLRRPLDEWRFSDFILFLLLLMSVVPGLAMCGAGAFPLEYMGLFYLYWGLFFFLARIFSDMKFNIPVIGRGLSPSAKEKILFLVGAIVVASIIFAFFSFQGGRFFFAGLLSKELYAYRAQFGTALLPVWLVYVLANALVVLLFLMLFCIGKRRYSLVALVLITGYMKFSCGANKIDLFSLLVGLVVYAGREYITAKRIIVLSIMVSIIGAALVLEWNYFYVMSLLVRELFDTNLLGYCYYDFFQTHSPFLYSIMDGSIIDRRAIPSMIGAQYMGDSACYANNGLLGDAFLMLGRGGVVLHPVCWVAYLFLLDKCSNGCAWWIKLGTSVYWVAVMQNGAFITSWLSHGGLMMLVLSYLCGSKKEKNMDRGSTVDNIEVL